MVERDGFEPEVSLAVLPTAQSETPVPPKSATEILAQETGARSPCAAPDRMSKLDMLNQFTTHIGTGVFACPGSVAEGGFIGERLFGTA